MTFIDNPIFINNINVTECAIFISDEFQQFTFDWYVTQQQLLLINFRSYLQLIFPPARFQATDK